VLRGDISGWLAKHRHDDRFTRFAHHFDVLDTVLSRMIRRLEDELHGVAGQATAETVYERCRDLDGSLLVVQRAFGWYADKYDQRLDDRRADALRAADEIVRSCWTEPFAALRSRPPTGPLPYLDIRFDAFATPRVSVPPDLRAPADALVAEYVRELPIPTIALPEVAMREPWWLVLVAHETGHHVQQDLMPTLATDTRSALASAAGAELADDWVGWSLEAFADAYSVLMVGQGAAWAIDELQLARPARLVSATRPGDRYPPPAVRLALLGELCRAAGIAQAAAPPGAADVLGWLRALPESTVGPAARSAVERHLAVVPAVAGALVELPVGGSTLRAVSGLRQEWFAGAGRVRGWSRQLRSPRPMLFPLGTRPAARLAIAAGVAVYTEPEAAGDLDRLRSNLLDVLPSCGARGVLAAPPPAADLRALADRLAARLVRGPTPGGPP
jgi:hypothetical protein